MTIIGILAYGSLIEDPGKEIDPLVCERRERIETPFSIESRCYLLAGMSIDAASYGL